MTRRMLLAVVAIFLHDAAIASNECGEPPPTQFPTRNDELLKGDLKGKAELLTKYVGDPSAA